MDYQDRDTKRRKKHHKAQETYEHTGGLSKKHVRAREALEEQRAARQHASKGKK
jgi:hypothetical protein